MMPFRAVREGSDVIWRGLSLWRIERLEEARLDWGTTKSSCIEVSVHRLLVQIAMRPMRQGWDGRAQPQDP